jgi:hypothetical protein
VNEISSLGPVDITEIDDIWCITIKSDRTKTDTARSVPIHRHLLDQGSSHLSKQRRMIGLPLLKFGGGPRPMKMSTPFTPWPYSLHRRLACPCFPAIFPET